MSNARRISMSSSPMHRRQSVARRIPEWIVDYAYHRWHRVQARRIFNEIEKNSGTVNKRYLTMAKEYSLDVFGSKRFFPWLRVYTAVAGKFIEGWIPDNFYGCAVVPQIKGKYGQTSNLKCLTKALLNAEYFPDICYYVNGLLLDIEYNIIDLDYIKSMLFDSIKMVVYKVDGSRQGSGIHFFDKDSLNLSYISELGNGVFQKFIIQNELFRKFSEKSVATLRITTAADSDGEPDVRACYLRLGASDDTHVQSRTHIRVPIDIKTGEFSAVGYLPNWMRIEYYPGTQLKFAGHRIPSFNDCISVATTLHRKIPFVRSVGWDLAVDHDGKVKVMEWNAEHNDIKFSEATQGPCFLGLGWEKISPRKMGLLVQARDA